MSHNHRHIGVRGLFCLRGGGGGGGGGTHIFGMFCPCSNIIRTSPEGLAGEGDGGTRALFFHALQIFQYWHRGTCRLLNSRHHILSSKQAKKEKEKKRVARIFVRIIPELCKKFARIFLLQNGGGGGGHSVPLPPPPVSYAYDHSHIILVK